MKINSFHLVSYFTAQDPNHCFAPRSTNASKIHLSNQWVFYPMFANCLHANIGSLFKSKIEIVFLPNVSKNTIECDWIIRNFQNVYSLEYFGKTDQFLPENRKSTRNRSKWQNFDRRRLMEIFF